MTDKFYYIPCKGCGEMIDEAQGQIHKWDGEEGYCLYCAEEQDSQMGVRIRTPSPIGENESVFLAYNALNPIPLTR